jgi:uncharacterized protein DUF5686
MRTVLLIIFFLLSIQLCAQVTIDTVLDKINLQSQKQDDLQKTLGNYKFKQFIHFIKYDGDDEIDEQSKREFNIFVKSDSLRKREIVSAFDFEDGEWIDVTDDEKNDNKEKESESKSFSLSEMVSPENRKLYEFEIVGEEYIDKLNTINLKVTSIEEDEERFQGHLWIETNDYNLVKADLSPSEMPTFVDNMQMFFELQKVDSLWFPKKIQFNAEVDVFFLFSGKIHSDIFFSEFEFNQQFEESWFNNLENAD